MQNATVLGAPTGGLRKCPQITKALRPHVVLLVDSSMIVYLTASGRNVSLLSRLTRSPSFEYVLNWSEMCETWSWTSCSKTALKAPHIAVTVWAGDGPAFHCRSDNLYCAWSRSLVASDRGPWNSGFDFPNVTSGCALGAGLGNRSYPVYMARVGAFGAGVPGVPVLACGGCRVGMAEKTKHCVGRERGTES